MIARAARCGDVSPIPMPSGRPVRARHAGLRGVDAQGASLFEANDEQAGQGRLGIVVALGRGQTFAVGTRRLVVVRFDFLPAQPTSFTVSFGDDPTFRDVSSADARSLPADFQAAQISNANPTASGVTISGRVTDAAGVPLAGVRVRLDGLAQAEVLTGDNGRYEFAGLDAAGVYVVSVSRRGYSFTPTK